MFTLRIALRLQAAVNGQLHAHFRHVSLMDCRISSIEGFRTF